MREASDPEKNDGVALDFGTTPALSEAAASWKPANPNELDKVEAVDPGAVEEDKAELDRG